MTLKKNTQKKNQKNRTRTEHMTSRSFMDAIKSVGRKSALVEGAKDKTSDGMTKDAKHFAQDLHKVQDAGVKHMIQKDSESKDYERMFSGGVEKAPTRLADVEPSQSVDKYVEYNEAVEAKKKAKKDEEKVGDQSDAEDATGPMESYVHESGGLAAGYMMNKNRPTPTNVNNPANNVKGPFVKDSYRTSRDSSSQPGTVQKFVGPNVAQSASRISPSGMSGSFTPSNQKDMASQTKKMKLPYKTNNTIAKPKTPGSETAAAGGWKGGAPGSETKIRDDMYGDRSKPQLQKPSGSTQQPYGMKTPLKKPGGSTQQPYGMNVPSKNAPPKPTPKPTQGGTAKPQAAKPQAAKPQAAKPQAAKPQAAKPQVAKPQAAKPKLNALQQQQKRSKTGRDALAGPSNLRQSYEIEWNGNSYVMNEAQIQALDAFIEKYGIMEGTAGEFIKKEMEHPEKLTAKGKKQKIKQSLAIYYSKKRRGENP